MQSKSLGIGWNEAGKGTRPRIEDSALNQPAGDESHLQSGGRTLAVGIAGPFSGPSARLGMEMRQAAELAIEERNASGGILGIRVEAVAADDRSNVEAGEGIARGLGADASVLGVVGHYNSDVTLAASDIYHADGLALITPIASNPALTERGLANVFRYTNRDDETGRAIAIYLRGALGKRRAVVFQAASLYGRSMADEFVRWFTSLGGQVLTRLPITEGEPEFGRLVAGLPADVDLFFYGGSFEGAALLRAIRAAGLRQCFAAGDGCWDVANFLEPAAEAATAGEGVLVLAASAAVGRVPGSEEFAERYTRRHGPIVNYALNSYDAARVLLLAIERAAAAKGAVPGRAEVVAAMRSVRFQGVAYSRLLAWDAKGDNRASVTVLNVVEQHRFREIAELGFEPGG
jgi:branched-chain amino acid transport system substrate-binding protein